MRSLGGNVKIFLTGHPLATGFLQDDHFFGAALNPGWLSWSKRRFLLVQNSF
jgi:hypothetical protein